MKEFINELKQRWNGAMPPFWKKIQGYALYIGGALTAVWIADTSLSLHLDNTFRSVISYLIVACAAIAGTAKFAIQDKGEAKKDETD